ncbi:MAG: hypothetical protein O2931_07005 [Planctomycetota bacterium]|nr:hypothetical protein [Planctomycetota bacterium]MDA1178528.1 hypothetical protein [Planctomycetota bacterium]
MFPFVSVSTARRIFLLGCLLPTLGVISWAAAKSLPGRSARVSQVLSDNLRLIANVTQFSTPKPGQLAYEQLQLLEPVTQEELARIESLTVSQRSGMRHLGSEEVNVHLRALPQLANWFQLHVFDAVSRQVGNYQVTVDSVYLQHGEQFWPVGRLTGTVTIAADRSEFHLEFCSSQSEISLADLQLDGEFIHTTTQQSGKIVVATVNNRPEPAFWLSSVAADLSLGPDAKWIGKLRWQTQYGGSWSTDMQGRFSHVELDHISNGAVSGSASIDLTSCRIQAGKIEELTATVRSPVGEIHQNWIQVLLDPRAPQMAPSPPAVRRYSSLAAGIAYVPEEAAWFLSPDTGGDRNEFLPILRDALGEPLVSLKESRKLPPLPSTH